MNAVALVGELETDPVFLRSCKEVLGRNVFPDGKKLKRAPAFLHSLFNFKNGSQPSTALLENPGALLYHLYYQFLILSDKEVVDFLLEQTELKVLTTETSKNYIYLSLVSGDLMQWKNSVITNLSETNLTESAREIYTKVLTILEGEGLNIFKGYSKQFIKKNQIALR